MIGLMYLKELILIRQMHSKNVIFVIIGIFQIKLFKYEQYLCNDLMQKAINFNDVAIVLLKEMITEFIFGIWTKMMQ